MNDITMTLSSPEVTLVAGKGSLSVSVTNASTASQRIVLGAFPVAAGDAGSTGAEAPAVAAIASVDRPLRTVAAGATEQYTVSFDVTASAPGDHSVRLIGYSADRAPEEYADQAQTVTLTVAAKAAPVKKFPWWIVIVAAGVLVAVAIAGVIFFVTRPEPTAEAKSLPWVPTGPANVGDASPDNWYALLESRDCAGLSAAGVESDPLWAAASALCAELVDNAVPSPATGVDQVAALIEPDAADCLNHAAWTLLDGFATIRTDHPDAPITIEDPEGTACPLGLLGVTVNTSTAVVQTASGTTNGGTTLRLIGRLEAPVVVKFGTDSIDATEVGENHFEIVTPAAPADTTVLVQVQSAGAAVVGAVLYTYVEPGTPPFDPCAVFPKPAFCTLLDERKIDNPFDGIFVNPFGG